jgi:acetolactate synthase-1/2/3 large subunit
VPTEEVPSTLEGAPSATAGEGRGAGSASMEGGDLLVAALAERGVRRVFSVSGGPLNSLYHAAATSPVQLVHTRHEAAAGFMADATARLGGVPGVCAVTLGPGTTNAITPLLTAAQAGVPVLVVGGQTATRNVDRGAGMAFDALPLMASVAKWAARVSATDRIPEYVDMAWRQMLAGRPGPVFLEVPVDVLGGPAGRGWGRRRFTAPQGPGLAAADRDRLREALAVATRLAVLAGDDVRWSEAGPALRRLVERWHVPFAPLRLARGAVDERHPLCAGPGYVGANPALLQALREADAVLLLGHDWEADLGFGEFVADHQRVVQTHPDAGRLHRNLAADLAVQARSDQVLEALLAGEPPARLDRAWADGVAAAWRAQRDGWARDAETGEPLHPLRAVELVRRAAPEDTLFVTSHGNVDFWADAWLQPAAPGRYLRAGQAGPLGAEVPFGVAARLALPEVPVVVFVGDGGFAFHGLELDTALRYGAPVTVVILDDECWGAIALPQERAYGGRFEMSLPRREWSRLACALGLHGEAADRAAQVGPAVARALASGRPAVVHVRVRSVESPYMRALTG